MKKLSLLTLSLALLMLLSSCGAAASSAVETTETGSTAAVSDSTANPYRPDLCGEWFLSPVTLEKNWSALQAGTGSDGTLKTPGQVTATYGGLEYTVDFFKESYDYGSWLQVRVTVHNPTAEAASCKVNFSECVIDTPDGKSMRFTTFHKDYTDSSELIPSWYSSYDIPAQESVVHEYIFAIAGTSWESEGTYIFDFNGLYPEDYATSDMSDILPAELCKPVFDLEIPLEFVCK